MIYLLIQRKRFMTSKKMNFLIILILLLFCSVSGFLGVYQYNLSLRLDAEHDASTAKQREEQEQNTLDNIKTSSSNESKNNIYELVPSVSSNGNTSTNVDVSQFDFLQMYTHAEGRLNKAPNIYSRMSGSAILNGPTSFGGIRLTNEKVTITAERAQNSDSSYFSFKVSGVLLNGLFNLNYESASYSEGSNHYWFFNQDDIGWQPSSSTTNYNKLRFYTNQTFNEITAESIKPETASLSFNKYDNTFIGSCELNPDLSGVRYCHTLSGVLDGNAPATILSSKIEVVFDKSGNFKSIKYIDTFKVDVYSSKHNTTMYATVQSNYLETFVSIGTRPVSVTKPGGVS